jgi:TonB family protein
MSVTMVPEGIRPAENDPDVHLRRLLAENTAKPFIYTLFGDLKEYFFPTPLPPLEGLTSKPVAVKDIWGFYGGQGKRSGGLSLLIHCSVVAIALFLGTNETIQKTIKDTTQIYLPDDLKPYMPPKKVAAGGGGGGGDRSVMPPAKGQLPKPSPKQFVPPAQVINNPQPKLELTPTIDIPLDAVVPNNKLPQWGDPLAKIGPPSNGSGSGSGIGSGKGGGIGSGSAVAWDRDPVAAWVAAPTARGGVSPPQLLLKVEPEYSEEARKAKYQGTVVLAVVVDENGKAQQLRVVRPLGLGLDEKAIEAVQKWKFRPGQLNGKPVPVQATIEVNFRLL